MTENPPFLVVGQPAAKEAALLDRLADECESDLVYARGPLEALLKLSRHQYRGIYVVPDDVANPSELARLIQSERILEAIPDGLALLDENKCILWANAVLRSWSKEDSLVGQPFFSVFSTRMGNTFCPFQDALAKNVDTSAVICVEGNRYFQLHVAVLSDRHGKSRSLIVSVRDITKEILQRQKLDAIHQAGARLADLRPEEIFELTIEERVELLKSNILQFTKDVLNFDVVEVRLLDQETSELIPLLSEGIDPAARDKVLFAAKEGNGVTGYVAATGESYICEDTTQDPHYIEGFKGARCSLTVPIIQHDTVIGTFNVESPIPGSFTDSDRQFLEIFSRSVAVALNTFELLVAQQANTAQASVDAIHGEVAMPVDAILNDVVNVMERYIGHDAEVTSRLQHVLKNARYIKQVIQRVGERMTPAEASPQPSHSSAYPGLRHRRILVVDPDNAVLQAAHTLLERHGCTVETAHEGAEAIAMVRTAGGEDEYDAILTDVRLKDLSGYDLFVKLKQVLEEVPLILMTGFGYDPGHSIVKARQAGLLPNAVLYKPFRLDQLLETVSSVVAHRRRLVKP